jgi:serine/threonine protein kinase
MHEMGYIHRDLKPANFLVSKEGRTILSDLGTVVKTKGDPMKGDTVGTPSYQAPETWVFATVKNPGELWDYINEKSDVWSCGMMLHYLRASTCKSLTHPAYPPKESDMAILHHLTSLTNPEGKKNYALSYPEPKDKNSLEHLIWSATQIDQENRPTMKEVREKYHQIRMLYENDPNKDMYDL